MSEIAFSEAPASWTVRYQTSDGFDLMLTLRGESGKDVLVKAEAALQWLREHGYLPQGASGKPAASNGESSVPICPTHQKPMKPSQHGGWYCPVKVADDDGTGKPVYCKQKVK